MAGLLDALNTDEARLGLGLLAAGGYSPTPMSFGQRIQSAMQGQDAYKQSETQKKHQQLQYDQGLLSFDKAKRAGETEQRFSEAARSSYLPTGFDQAQFLAKAYGIDPMKAMQLEHSMANNNSPLTVAPGATLVDRKTLVPVFTAPKEMVPTDVGRLFAEMQALPPGDPRAVHYANAIKKATTHQPSTVVNTGDNLGLKPKDRFEMEDKLRNDYTKANAADQEIISNSTDLVNILAQPGALKDQAAIYKFAKGLDPLGAVREADYAAIVKTAGGLDYVTALVTKAINGEKLSPKQRAEMGSLSQSMALVAQQRVAKQQGVYSSRAKMYNLAPENVFNPAPAAGSNEWGIIPKGQ